MDEIEKARFWQRVKRSTGNPKHVCWLWHGHHHVYGEWCGKKAHRISYELCVGPIPEGHCVMHKCDTPGCVNPYHLTTGTHKDNMQDMVQKGRHVSPASNRLWSDDQVRNIREDYRNGSTPKQLSVKYGSGIHAMRNLLKGKTYQDIV